MPRCIFGACGFKRTACPALPRRLFWAGPAPCPALSCNCLTRTDHDHDHDHEPGPGNGRAPRRPSPRWIGAPPPPRGTARRVIDHAFAVACPKEAPKQHVLDNTFEAAYACPKLEKSWRRVRKKTQHALPPPSPYKQLHLSEELVTSPSLQALWLRTGLVEFELVEHTNKQLKVKSNHSEETPLELQLATPPLAGGGGGALRPLGLQLLAGRRRN